MAYSARLRPAFETAVQGHPCFPDSQSKAEVLLSHRIERCYPLPWCSGLDRCGVEANVITYQAG